MDLKSVQKPRKATQSIHFADHVEGQRGQTETPIAYTVAVARAIYQAQAHRTLNRNEICPYAACEILGNPRVQFGLKTEQVPKSSSTSR